MTDSIQPRKLVLDLLLAQQNAGLNARHAVWAGACFGIAENTVRVCLNRLNQQGVIELAERGVYRLGASSESFAKEVAGWRQALKKMVKWNGRYAMVLGHSVGRSDRTLLRHFQQGMHMSGFVELERDVFIRPNNLRGGLAGLRKRFHSLSVPDEVRLLEVSDIEGFKEDTLKRCWDISALNKGYRQGSQTLIAWLQNGPRLAPMDAARESYVLGGQAIRNWVYDPLLPDSWVDAEARREYAKNVEHFDRAGHRIWQMFFEHEDALVRSTDTAVAVL